MKKIIILAVTVLVLAAIGIVSTMFVSNYIAASGPAGGETAYIMFNSKLYSTTSSCAEVAFKNIEQTQGFVKSPKVITSAIKTDKTPTKDLTTNFRLFVKKELYTSDNKPDEIYIRTVVNNEIRYYLFTLAGDTQGV